MSHSFVITLVYTISSICTFDHVASSVTLAQVHTARHLYLRCSNFCNAEMFLYVYRAVISIWRIYRRWLTLFVPVNYCTFFYAPLFVFFLAKSLYVVFGCTLSTNKMIFIIIIIDIYINPSSVLFNLYLLTLVMHLCSFCNKHNINDCMIT